MDKLPQELIDNIISSIDRTRSNSRSTLLACCRVSRSWRRQAQKELFSYVQFVNKDQLERWGRNVPPESEVPSYVRRLHWAVPEPSNESGPFLENSFPGRFASFSNIKALYVSDLSLRRFDTTAIERTFSHLSRSLRSLEISYLTTDSEKWCFLVSLFPNLRQINVSSVTMLEGGSPSPNHPRSFNFTGHIAPYRHDTEKFFRCIAGLNPRFQSFEVRILDDASVDTLNLVMRRCSATLTTISITPIILGMKGNPTSQSKLTIANIIRSVARAMSQLDLSPCRNLRVLRVRPEMVAFPEFNGFLQTISSKHFEKLILGPNFDIIPPNPDTSDQAFHSFAERLSRLGAMKSLTMVLEFFPVKGEMPNALDVERIWPLFCEVGVIAEDHSGWNEWTCRYT